MTAPPLVFHYDPALPVCERRDEILRVLAAHPVMIVAGDTGSGKSTQLPKFCLEAGRGTTGRIAHTQPRRLAARALAARIAQEMAQPVGAAVGFRVRFADRVSADTRLLLMTDGMLLAELASDPELRRYDTIIVDEAHERTLNVDLLLGVLRRLLPRRPELKLIVTSATLDVERIAGFFGGAQVVTVCGRNHPIEVRYRADPAEPEDPDLPGAVLQALQEIAAEPGAIGCGDVLVFLPGEREIRDVGELLERELQQSVEIIPLYSRLAWEQQSRIFQRGARRRVVLATNVAETSITVPGIRAVVDSGLARISRYSARSRLQRLPIEPISRASAEQRKGRCGRLGAGLCLRLYSEEDFAARAAFTEPEILRTNLAALLLRLAADGLGEAERFPFIDPPDARALNDGYRLLQELAALDADRCITRRGRAMARLPLDPRLARALLESKRFHAENELLAIVAGLSVPDVRIAEAGGRSGGAAGGGGGAEAAESPAANVFEDTKSEFSSLYKIWRGYRKAREGARRELRRWCKERRLSLLRLSEWDNVYAQVADRAAELGIVVGRRQPGREASYTAVHRSLLAGFCTSIGMRGEAGVYLGTRGVHFHLFPGSPLKRRKPRWVMAANIVETSRVFARQIAEIEPGWIEAAAEHLLKREYLEPDWDENREEVVARERISFLGLTLSAGRVINYGPIAPEESRLIFAREALVYRRLQRRPDWLRANDAAIEAAERVEERLRTRALIVPAETLIEFYDHALPRQVSSGATLEHFTRHLTEAQRQSLKLRAGQIFAHTPDPAALAQFPESIEVSLGPAAGSVVIAIEYRFAPDEPGDGATLRLPLLAVPLLTRAALDAAVPGFAEPRAEALLRSLPKEARRSLIPIAGTAAAFLASAGGVSADPMRLAEWLTGERGVPAPLIRFEPAAVPAYLRPRLSVIDAGTQIAAGDDLEVVRRATAGRARAVLDAAAHAAHPAQWRRFECEALAANETIRLAEGALAVFPTLVRGEQGVHVRLEFSAAEAERSYLSGAVQLARVVLGRQARDLTNRIGEDSALLLTASPYLAGPALVEAVLQTAFRQACFPDSIAPREREAFEARVEQARSELSRVLDEVCAEWRGWFGEARAVRRLIDDPRARALGAVATESRAHLEQLLDGETLAAAPADWLRQIPRYLKAEERRWQRLLAGRQEPPAILRELTAWAQRAARLAVRAAAELRRPPQLDELRWWIREFRVSSIAQELKTLGPVSGARLEQRAAALEAWLRR
jgi:ATP-dependent helicase HrpA